MFPADLIDLIFELILDGNLVPLAELIEKNNKSSKEKLPEAKTGLIRVIGEFLLKRP